MAARRAAIAGSTRASRCVLQRIAGPVTHPPARARPNGGRRPIRRHSCPAATRCRRTRGEIDPQTGSMVSRLQPAARFKPNAEDSGGVPLCHTPPASGTVREEYGLRELPIVSNMDFGHTDPMMVLPMGLRLRIDSERGQLAILDAPVI